MRKADTSPRILNRMVDHAPGKPSEQISQEQVTFVTHVNKQAVAQDAEVIDGDQKYLLREEEE